MFCQNHDFNFLLFCFSTKLFGNAKLFAHESFKVEYTVDSRYLDPSYLDPIIYVELISKSRLFSLCIYCITASRMSNYFYVDTSAISSIIFSP